MYREFVFLLLVLGVLSPFGAATAVIARPINTANGTTTGYNYNYMYPYMNNQMRTVLNPGVTPSLSSNPIDTVVRTVPVPGTQARRVVPRSSVRVASGTAGARSTPSVTAGRTVSARSGVRASGTSSRQVVARSATNGGGRVIARTGRADDAYANRALAPVATGRNVTTSRCLTDYVDCMNNYCQRDNTAYNRCYCSAKLAQIDSKYQTQIESLMMQILKLQGTNNWTDAEMNEYWMGAIGQYTGENVWQNIDDALNIDWAGTESRVRGQNAFITGHEYCVQNLSNCATMASNLRDAYRSEIARDCAVYEAGLQKIKAAAESVIDSYTE